MYVTATGWMALWGILPMMHNTWAAGWIQGVATMPMASLIVGAASCLVDPDLEDAARMDAHGAVAALRVQAPVLGWGIAMAALGVMVLALWDVTVTDILIIRTFGEEVFTQFQLGAGASRALALALPTLALAGVACGGLVWVGRRASAVPLMARLRSPRLLPLGVWRIPALLLCVGLGVLLMGVPFWALLKDLGSLAALTAAWRVASTELLYTLTVTPLAALLTLALALPLVWRMVHYARWRFALATLLVVWLCVPAPVVGITLIYCLNQPVLDGLLYDTWGAVVVCHTLRALPFVALVLLPAVAQTPRDVRDACAVDGVPAASLFFRVILPMHWRSLLVGFCVAFVLSLAELGATYLVIPPGKTTLSVRFFTLIHYGVYSDAAGLCLMLSMIVAFVAGIPALLLLPFRARPCGPAGSN
ncbi:MAG: iron(III) transport system permease protein [Candidatus Promineifilaceae bacterium]